MNNNLAMSQQRALAAMSANCLLGCVSKSVVSRSRENYYFPLSGFVTPRVEYSVCSRPSQYNTAVAKSLAVTRGDKKFQTSKMKQAYN